MAGRWQAPQPVCWGWLQASVEGSGLPGHTGWQLAAPPPPLSSAQRGLCSCSEHLSLAGWAAPPSPHSPGCSAWPEPTQRPACPCKASLASEDPIHRELESSKGWICRAGQASIQATTRMGLDRRKMALEQPNLNVHQFGPRFSHLYNGGNDDNPPTIRGWRVWLGIKPGVHPAPQTQIRGN